MKVLKVFLIFLIGIYVGSCAMSSMSDESFIDNESPPNGVKLARNFYCDYNEITNFNYAEFIFWNERVYGKSSKKYLNTLIDSTIWIDKDSCLSKFSKYYLNHPAYRDYPVVGVSQAQALDYSKWRSDRVFEYILIREGIIKYDSSQNSKTVFSIENFFNNKIPRIDTLTKVVYYPNFRLPTMEERKFILHYADSVDHLNQLSYTSKYSKSNNVDLIHCEIMPCLNRTEFKVEPLRNVDFIKTPRKVKTISDLRGNASEWAYERNITFGGSWGNTKAQIFQSDTLSQRGKSKFVGFRNVCSFEKWND